jgi:hypothetical protein
MSSSIGNVLIKLEKQKFWLNFWGIICLPVCCIGINCIIVGDVINDFCPKYKKLIALYGGNIQLEILSKKIEKELELFKKAVTFTNSVVDANIIRINITIMDVIFDMNPRIKNILLSSAMDSLFASVDKLRNEKEKNYSEHIWNRYNEIGGCYHILIYGYIEYLCMLSDSNSSSSIIEMLTKMTSDTIQRVECLSHREEAGFVNLVTLENYIEIKKKL